MGSPSLPTNPQPNDPNHDPDHGKIAQILNRFDLDKILGAVAAGQGLVFNSASGLFEPGSVTGPAGPAGATGPAGPVGMTFAGAYANLTAYPATSAVTYNGGLYLALVAIPSTNTTAPVDDGVTWSLIAEPGANGADSTVPGPQGNNGLAPLILRCSNPAQGLTSDPLIVGPHLTLLGVTLSIDPPGPSSSEVLQLNVDTGSGPSPVYTTLANRPQLAANQTATTSMPTPDVTDLPSGAKVTATIVTAPSAGGSTPSPGTATSGYSSTAVSMPAWTMPSNAAAGKLLVAAVSGLTSLALPTSDGSGASNGWLTAKNPYTGATQSLDLLVIYKIATSATDAFPSSLTVGAASRMAWACVAVDSVDNVTPLDSNSASSTFGGGSQSSPAWSQQFPTIAPGSGGETLLYVGAQRFPFSYDFGIKAAGPGGSVTDLATATTTGNTGANVGIYLGMETAPAAGVASTGRALGEVGDSTMNNAPAAWSATTGYAQNATAMDNDANGVPQVWKKYSAGTTTSATHPKDDATNWVRSGYDAPFAQATFGIRGSSGGPSTNLVAYLWTRPV